jgi:hypothetical protein
MAKTPEAVAPLEPKADMSKQLDSDVMNILKEERKPSNEEQAQKIKEQLLRIIKEQNFDPKMIVRSGELAYQILQNPASWKQVTQQAIQEGVATPQDLQQEPTRDELVQIYASGEVVRKLILEGKV